MSQDMLVGKTALLAGMCRKRYTTRREHGKAVQRVCLGCWKRSIYLQWTGRRVDCDERKTTTTTRIFQLPFKSFYGLMLIHACTFLLHISWRQTHTTSDRGRGREMGSWWWWQWRANETTRKWATISDFSGSWKDFISSPLGCSLERFFYTFFGEMMNSKLVRGMSTEQKSLFTYGSTFLSSPLIRLKGLTWRLKSNQPGKLWKISTGLYWQCLDFKMWFYTAYKLITLNIPENAAL